MYINILGNINIFAFLLVTALLSFSFTALVRNYAIKKGIIDIPNHRSSHVDATPRGGGLAIVITVLGGVIFLAFSKVISIDLASAVIGGGIIVALIGWIDDKRNLSAKSRIVFHFIAAGWALFCLGGFPYLNLGFTLVPLSFIGMVVSLIGIVWFTNLYNFMDGIDGLAGTEAISVAVIAGVLSFFYGATGISFICWILVTSSVGFLIWNWPPAKVFMGDVGSGFLGYIFAVLAIISEKSSSVPLIIWLILLGVFITDTTITLLIRLTRGDKLSQAHRNHVYQLAVQVGYSHKQVTISILFINVFLAVLAITAIRYRIFLLWVCLATFLFLIILHFLAGRRFHQRLNNRKVLDL